MNDKKLELLKQSLTAAESSLKLAKQLLSELDSASPAATKIDNTVASDDLPGITGVFDGENMVSASGEIYPVPVNYASKSMLVVGDTLKLVEEGKNKDKRFKQIEHVKRHKSTGILTKKDGKWKVVTPEGSYKVLGSAVEHFGADIGSEVTLHLPANNLTVSYAAIESAKAEPKKAEENTEVTQSTQDRQEKKITPEVIKKVEVEKKPVVKKEPPKPIVSKPVETKKEPVVSTPAPISIPKEEVVAPDSAPPAAPAVSQVAPPVAPSSTEAPTPMEIPTQEEELS